MLEIFKREGEKNSRKKITSFGARTTNLRNYTALLLFFRK